MADIQPIFTILQAMIACGVNNVHHFNGESHAARLSDEIFSNDFASCTDKTPKELEDDFLTYSDLTQLQGQIRLLPGYKKNIKAFM